MAEEVVEGGPHNVSFSKMFVLSYNYFRFVRLEMTKHLVFQMEYLVYFSDFEIHTNNFLIRKNKIFAIYITKNYFLRFPV